MYGYGSKRSIIDLHGMTIAQAELELTRKISILGNDIKQVVVIHGYNGGSRLLEFVRKEYRHPRVRGIIYTDNYGETVYTLY